MNVRWTIGNRDINAVRHLMTSANGNKFVGDRVRRNIEGRPAKFTRSEFWRVMLGCLITTQQRSGPDSHVAHFMRTKPFPLRFEGCTKTTISDEVRRQLRSAHIRRAPTIAKQAAVNVRWLERGGWSEVEKHYKALMKQRIRPPRSSDERTERIAATFIDENLKGFGPKQARNLWQWLGMTRHEIPLDSRITKWLNQNIFDVKLNAMLLGDRGYYEFVLDGVQALCKKSRVVPCVFDAAVFSSTDRDWSKVELRGI
jgi:hypothetical protein